MYSASLYLVAMTIERLCTCYCRWGFITQFSITESFRFECRSKPLALCSEYHFTELWTKKTYMLKPRNDLWSSDISQGCIGKFALCCPYYILHIVTGLQSPELSLLPFVNNISAMLKEGQSQ